MIQRNPLTSLGKVKPICGISWPSLPTCVEVHDIGPGYRVVIHRELRWSQRFAKVSLGVQWVIAHGGSVIAHSASLFNDGLFKMALP